MPVCPFVLVIQNCGIGLDNSVTINLAQQKGLNPLIRIIIIRHGARV